MASPPPYTFSRPVELHRDEEFDHAVRFAEDKRDAALMPVLRARTPGVVTVTDEPSQWQNAIEQAGAQLLGHIPGAYAGYVRDGLRPASRCRARPVPLGHRPRPPFPGPWPPTKNGPGQRPLADRGQARNDMDTPTPRCARCSGPFLPEQAGQKYCSTRCREAAKKRRQRFRVRRGELPVPRGTSATRDDGSVTEPGDDLREFSNYNDVTVYENSSTTTTRAAPISHGMTATAYSRRSSGSRPSTARLPAPCWRSRRGTPGSACPRWSSWSRSAPTRSTRSSRHTSAPRHSNGPHAVSLSR